MRLLKIEELYNYPIEENNYTSYYDGYKIETSKENIYLLISNYSKCCEHYGYICNEDYDDLSYYYGSKIVDIDCIEKGTYNPILKLADLEESDIDVLDCAFINIKFEQSTLQFAVYNNHNGWYGHDVKIVRNPK